MTNQEVKKIMIINIYFTKIFTKNNPGCTIYLFLSHCEPAVNNFPQSFCYRLKNLTERPRDISNRQNYKNFNLKVCVERYWTKWVNANPLNPDQGRVDAVEAIAANLYYAP